MQELNGGLTEQPTERATLQLQELRFGSRGMSLRVHAGIHRCLFFLALICNSAVLRPAFTGRPSLTRCATRPSSQALKNVGFGQISLGSVTDEISAPNMAPVEAVNILLRDEDVEHDELKLKKLRKVLDQSLEKGGQASVAPMVARMLQWDGLEPQQEKSHGMRSAKKFPIFFTAFAAVRSYCRENADFFSMQELGAVLEALTTLARKMWAADDRVTGSMSMILNKELMNKGEATSETADIIGTLGLREPFQAMAVAALDIPREDMKHVDAVASMAWALAVANIQLASLQIKVAKGIIAHIDKVSPPDIGKLFMTMHEMEWFKDADAIAYLTQALVARIQTLKEEDPGLASMLAARTREAQEAEAQDGA
eukprot:s2226_g6.t1